MRTSPAYGSFPQLLTRDLEQIELCLNAQESHVYREFFRLANVEQKSFPSKQEAMSFFSNAGVPSAFLEEVYIENPLIFSINFSKILIFPFFFSDLGNS